MGIWPTVALYPWRVLDQWGDCAFTGAEAPSYLKARKRDGRSGGGRKSRSPASTRGQKNVTEIKATRLAARDACGHGSKRSVPCEPFWGALFEGVSCGKLFGIDLILPIFTKLIVSVQNSGFPLANRRYTHARPILLPHPGRAQGVKVNGLTEGRRLSLRTERFERARRTSARGQGTGVLGP